MKSWKDIALLAPIIIIAGLLKQIIYYAFFNVPIVQFIDLNEIIVLFSEDILHIIGLFVILGFISFLGHNAKTKWKLLRFQVKYYNENEILLRIWKYITINYVNILILLGLAILIWSDVFDKEELDVTTRILIGIDTTFFLIRFGIYEIKRELYRKGKLEKKNKRIENNFAIFILAINLILIFSVKEVDRVKYQGKYSNVTITLKNDTLVSDSTSFFIGKTKNYIFFYKTQTNKTRVIPCNRVLEIEFGKIIRPFWVVESKEESDSTKLELEVNIDSIGNTEKEELDSITRK